MTDLDRKGVLARLFCHDVAAIGDGAANKRCEADKRRKGCKCALLGRWVVVVVVMGCCGAADEAMVTAPQSSAPSVGSRRLTCGGILTRI